jgi:hypothetical protein
MLAVEVLFIGEGDLFARHPEFHWLTWSRWIASPAFAWLAVHYWRNPPTWPVRVSSRVSSRATQQ